MGHAKTIADDAHVIGARARKHGFALGGRRSLVALTNFRYDKTGNGDCQKHGRYPSNNSHAVFLCAREAISDVSL
jgi:hypothetical protein